MAQKAALEELLQFIRILILDDDLNVGKSTMIRLQQNGYPYVDFTNSTVQALEMLEKTNILLIDHYLADEPLNGIEFTKAAKEKFGANLDVIIYSGSVEKLAHYAKEVGATACLEKPLNFDYLQLWIKETAKRIWMEKILDTIPDEVIVIDPRDEQFGLIHYANRAKKKLFEGDTPLEYDYCWKRFERQGTGEEPCANCLSHSAKEEQKTVRAFWNYTDWFGRKGCVDLHSAPIYDRIGVIRGIIETARDRTNRELVNTTLRKIESAPDWETKLKLFMEGFTQLGYPRIRFYQKLVENNQEVFHGLLSVGMPDNFDLRKFSYVAATDPATEIILRDQHATLFVVKKNLGFRWDPMLPYHHVYRVDDNLVLHNDILKKKKWVDVPVLADGKLIAKVSIEPQDPKQFITNYELEVLSHYASHAGQALENAARESKLQLSLHTNQIIIDINQKISKRPIHHGWMYRALEQVCNVLDSAGCSVFMLEGRGIHARLVRKSNFTRDIHGAHVEKKLKPESYRTGQFLIGSVFQAGKDVIENDLITLSNKQDNKSGQSLNLKAYHDFVRHIGEPVQNAMFAVMRSEGRKIGIIRVLDKKRSDIFGNRNYNDDDLTALKALAGQIALAYETASMIKKLKESQKLKELIAQEYSHTLKNLMQPMVTISGLLQRDPTDQELWDLMSDEIARMKTTINTMLRLVQAEATGLEVKKSETDIRELLNKVIRPYRIHAEDKKMEIKLSVTRNLPKLAMDQTLIYDAVANLLDNAIKYGDSGTTITVAARLQKTTLLLTVRNIGETIPKEERNKVFEKYYRSKGYADTVSQIGLGLTYVKVVAEEHHGKVYVDPRFTKGTKIVIKLPIHLNLEAK